MIIFDKNSKQQLIDLNKLKNITLEGNIAKVIDTSDDKEFKEYIDNCISIWKYDSKISLINPYEVEIKYKNEKTVPSKRKGKDK